MSEKIKISEERKRKGERKKRKGEMGGGVEKCLTIVFEEPNYA